MIWLVVADCGDYYCEGSHVIAVAESEADAARLRDEALAMTEGNGNHIWKTWASVNVVESELGVLRGNA